MAVKTITGSAIVLSVDLSGSTSPTAVAGATTGSLSVNQETIDVTNKDSSGRKEFINGVKSWTLDCEAFTTSSGETVSGDTSIAALEAGTKIYVQFRDGSGQASAKKYTGYGYITSIGVNANVGEFSTYSVSIAGTGQLTAASA
jgi:TP901-1 family phage major tail protein